MESSIAPSAKKRSFDSPPSELSPPPEDSLLLPTQNMEGSSHIDSDGGFDSRFDREFKSIVGGDLSIDALRQLEEVSAGDIQRGETIFLLPFFFLFCLMINTNNP